MSHNVNRRNFLGTTAASGAAFGLGSFAMNQLGFVGKLPPVSAAETRLEPGQVRDGSGIEPLVKLLEDTPQDELLEKVAHKVRQGTSYRDVLAALLLAGVRNVQPRPSVGFKFHAVLVVNSAHLASLSAPDSDRWMPIFWAIDYFKAKQLEEARTSGWTLPPVDESAVPAAHQANAAFIQAMERWDEEAADAAVAGLARSAGAVEVFELLSRFGGRDYRSIGHKAIYVANSWRTLQCIGWHHAEPVLRSLTYALLNHHGEPNPSESDLAADRPWRQNQELEKKIRGDWLEGKLDAQATRDLVTTIRNGSPEEAANQCLELLNAGVAPQSLWDAVFISAGELLMRQPGIIGLHTLTTANAMHYAFQTSGDDRTRRLLLLQNCSFLPMFRESAQGRGRLSDQTIERFDTAKGEQAKPASVDQIFADVSSNRDRAAMNIRGFLQAGGNAETIITAAQRLIFQKGDDAHDYKFSSAVLEDYYHVSPQWRDLFLALGSYNLLGSGHRDNRMVEKIRAALT